MCTLPRAGVGIGNDSDQDCGGPGFLGRPTNNCDVRLLGIIMCESPCNSIVKRHSDDDHELSDGIDAGIRVDAVVQALSRPPEGDDGSTGDGKAAEEARDGKAQQWFGMIGEAADAGVPDEPSVKEGQTRQSGPEDAGLGQDGSANGEPGVRVSRRWQM